MELNKLFVKLDDRLISEMYCVYLELDRNNSCDDVNQVFDMELKQELIDDNAEEKDLTKFSSNDKYFTFLNDQNGTVISSNNLYSLLNHKEIFIVFVLEHADLILERIFKAKKEGQQFNNKDLNKFVKLCLGHF